MSAPDLPIIAKLTRIRMHPYLENASVLERPAPVNRDGPEAAEVIKELYEAAESAFQTLIYIFETTADDTDSGAAKEAADKLEPALSRARGEEVGNG